MSQITTKWIADDAISADKLDSSGNFTINKLTTTSDSTVGGNLKVVGTTSITGPISLTDATLSGGLRVGTDASVVNNLFVGNVEHIFSKLGIGQDATSPERALHIETSDAYGTRILIKQGPVSHAASYSLISGGSASNGAAGGGKFLIKDEDTGARALLLSGADARFAGSIDVGVDATVSGTSYLVGHIGVNTAPDPSYSIDVDTAGSAVRLNKTTGLGVFCETVLGWYAGSTQSALSGSRGLVIKANDSSNLELRTDICNIILNPNDPSVTINADTTIGNALIFGSSDYKISTHTGSFVIRSLNDATMSVVGAIASETASIVISQNGVASFDSGKGKGLKISSTTKDATVEASNRRLSLQGASGVYVNNQGNGVVPLSVFNASGGGGDTSSCLHLEAQRSGNTTYLNLGFAAYPTHESYIKSEESLTIRTDATTYTSGDITLSPLGNANIYPVSGYVNITPGPGAYTALNNDVRITATAEIWGASSVPSLDVYSPDSYAIDASSKGTVATIRVQNTEPGGLSLYAVAGNNSAIAASNNSVPADTAYFENGAAGGTVLRTTTTMPNGKALIVDASDPDGTAIVATGKSYFNGNIGISTLPDPSYSLDVETAGLAVRVSKVSTGSETVLGWYGGGAQSALVGSKGLVLYAQDSSTLELKTSTGSCGIVLDPNGLSTVITGDATVAGTSGQNMVFTGNDLIFQRDGNCYIRADGGTSSTLFFTADTTTVMSLRPNRIKTSVMVGFGTNNPDATVDIAGGNGYTQLRLGSSFTPSGSADALGTDGVFAWDANFIYVKTAPGAWKRASLNTF